MVTAQEMGKKGGKATSEAKTAAARKNAAQPRRKWLTVFHYGVIGNDDELHVGQVVIFSRFSLDLATNGEQINDQITEDLIDQAVGGAALPWKQLVHFGGCTQPMP